MNLTYERQLPFAASGPPYVSSADDTAEEQALIRRLWALVSLLALYATTLFVVSLVSDGPDVGCILVGIAGHVLYASKKTMVAWRETSFMLAARNRVQLRQRA